MLSVRLYGNGPIEVIGQTRLHPTGEADGEPLATFEDASSDFELCPGDNVLVRSYVNARALADGSPPVLFRTAEAFAALAIKLRVHTCGGRPVQNHTLVDIGRQIVVPGNAGIEVVAPSGFSTSRPADIENVSEYFVQVIVCPVRCCYPPLPHLTFWRNFIGEAEEGERTFVVPRGARRMVVCDMPAGITEVTMLHQGNTIGTRPLAAGDVVEVFGAADEVVFGPGVTGAGDLLVRWEIEG